MWPRKWGKRRRSVEIHPDEIFIDAENLPAFDTDQFEGRIEKPLSRRSFVLLGFFLCGIFVAFVARASDLQLIKGEAYATQARENQLAEEIIFADRGIIEDRMGEVLAGNERVSVEDDFANRSYAPFRGLSHLIGYAKAPAKDSSGFYFRDSFIGIDGAEKSFDGRLSGTNGVNLIETNAKGETVSHAVVRQPVSGEKLTLSLDAKVTQALHDAISERAAASRFQGGAGVVLDVRSGEVLALTNVPEYSPQALAEGSDEAISAYQGDTRQPFLNRATSGLYAPGSIVKPFVAVGALTERIIDEFTQIVSTGQISIPNPYDPSNPSIFRDWKAHGAVDMRHALAVSSDVYFYEVGGGFQNQPGLGINKIDEYFRLFGFGAPTGIDGFEESAGTIPTPEWKEATFDGDPWRVGNTYHTAIGQYGVQVTPLQAARATAAIASGMLPTPTIEMLKDGASAPEANNLSIDPHILKVVQEGMHLSVKEGTAAAINVPYVDVAGKTGTAQLGTANQFMNSWIIGFWPYENPRYAFAVVLEKSPAGTAVGAPAAMRAFFDWMNTNAPEYLK